MISEDALAGVRKMAFFPCGFKDSGIGFLHLWD
jgi:hypothetical protein